MNNQEVQEHVVGLILAERERQEAKWGQQDHEPEVWLTILGEEFGEFCKALLEFRFGKGCPSAMQKELVQIAAVAVAMLECCDRQEWCLGGLDRFVDKNAAAVDGGPKGAP